MFDHGYRRFLPGDDVRLHLEIIKFARSNVREAGVVFRHVEHDQSELTASGPPETIGGQSTVARLPLPIPAVATPGLYRVNRMWVETYGDAATTTRGKRYQTTLAGSPSRWSRSRTRSRSSRSASSSKLPLFTQVPRETVWEFRISPTVDSYKGSKRSQRCHFAAFTVPPKQTLYDPSSDFPNSF